jgi:lipopolysaccharide biosynthesis glycosyltransferase
LWQEPLAGAPCLAVQDPGAPYIDSLVALAHRPNVCKHLVNQRPIPNFVELGLAPEAPYFNGGLLVADLDLWRRERLATQMIDVLRTHREHVTYWDQYALNVVLSGRWKAVDPRWNQNAYVLRQAGWECTIFSRDEHEHYTREPWIVHFNWLKPWQAECNHPLADAFLAYLDGSPWQMTLQRVVAAPRRVRKHSKLRTARDYVRSQLRHLRQGVSAWLGRRAA